MKLKSVITGIVVSIALVSAVSAQTLQEALQQTIDENPEIMTSRDERLAAEQEIDQAKAGYFPTVDVSAAYGFDQSNNPTTRARIFGSQLQQGTTQYSREESSLMVRQMIFDGMATQNEVARQKARTNSKAYSVFGRSEIVGLRLVEAFLNVLRREELLQLAEENLAIHIKTNDQIKLRGEQGVGKKADLEQSTGRLSVAETSVRAEEGNLLDAKTAFQRIVGVLPGKLEMPAEPNGFLPADIDTAVEKAVNNHPILKSANEDIESAISQHETAKAAYLPNVYFEGGGTFNRDIGGVPGPNQDISAMVRIKYNLFNGGKNIARRDETGYLIAQAKDIRDNAYRQVVESMRLSWVAHQTIKNQMEFFKFHSAASVKTQAAYQLQFNIGQRTLLDLLDSANEMFIAKTAYTNAKFDATFAAYRILASMGELNQSIGVVLPQESAPLESAIFFNTLIDRNSN
jgi:adhesin transport system outer membrane protein